MSVVKACFIFEDSVAIVDPSLALKLSNIMFCSNSTRKNDIVSIKAGDLLRDI